MQKQQDAKRHILNKIHICSVSYIKNELIESNSILANLQIDKFSLQKQFQKSNAYLLIDSLILILSKVC